MKIKKINNKLNLIRHRFDLISISHRAIVFLYILLIAMGSIYLSSESFAQSPTNLFIPFATKSPSNITSAVPTSSPVTPTQVAVTPSVQSKTVSRLYLPLTSGITLQRTKASLDAIPVDTYLLSDYLSSTLATSEKGILSTNTQYYYPYGTTVDKELPNTDKKFTSHRQIEETGIYHAGARFYSPTLGVFIQPDSVEGPNRYAYVGGNPVAFNDPTGHCPMCIGAIIGAGLDIGIQVFLEGKTKINWKSVAISAAGGAVGAGIAGNAAKIATKFAINETMAVLGGDALVGGVSQVAMDGRPDAFIKGAVSSFVGGKLGNEISSKINLNKVFSATKSFLGEFSQAQQITRWLTLAEGKLTGKVTLWRGTGERNLYNQKAGALRENPNSGSLPLDFLQLPIWKRAKLMGTPDNVTKLYYEIAEKHGELTSEMYALGAAAMDASLYLSATTSPAKARQWGDKVIEFVVPYNQVVDLNPHYELGSKMNNSQFGGDPGQSIWKGLKKALIGCDECEFAVKNGIHPSSYQRILQGQRN